ncbi:uncharacterized protein A1O5_01177 [Cladophialophora psammophila CBS 110553]|uniref:Uncharacterized protein n=1 Tax=Cladophialophora psammophila CBS 110553 TaxID=1182543 RepID=W9Y2G8_9EURO|nr:uncharacterized protein A1O5_01177 [Cladophialophora psammophila CBS 110553]EXJ76669.1 hypothetical protein A1O5_01177 [Cladophialophora psammophila CBS 110553]
MGTYDSDGRVLDQPYTWNRTANSATETVSNLYRGNPVMGGTGLIGSFFSPFGRLVHLPAIHTCEHDVLALPRPLCRYHAEPAEPTRADHGFQHAEPVILHPRRAAPAGRRHGRFGPDP